MRSNSILIVVAGILLLSNVAGQMQAQSNHRNYIISRTMLDKTESAFLDKFDYYDGFGRPVQSVYKSASPSHYDIVSWLQYDFAGRISKTWIPIPIPVPGTGNYASDEIAEYAAQLFYNDSFAYTENHYEPSPLNRIIEQYGPGSPWHTGGKSVETGWLTNTSPGEFSCALYVVASDNTLQRKGLYAASELYITHTTDEDSLITYTFTDKQGQIVLLRVMDGSVQNDTYYVYDDLGNLCYVLPPVAADALTATTTWDDNNTTLKNYAYIYKYDVYNRCIRKKLPGCDPIVMKYDKADRLIFSQDGNQLSKNQWTFLFYDLFGRQTATGIWKSATIPALDNLVVKTDYTGSGSLAGYNVNLTLSAVDLLTVNYYDNYTFTTGLSPLNYVVPPTGYGTQYNSAKGLLTGTRTYQLDDPAKYTLSAIYYDDRGRIVQTHTSNHLGGYEDEYFAYTFTGKVTQRQHVHSAPGKTTQTEVYTYAYDHAERLLSVTHKLNSAAAVTLSQNTYDEIGRMLTKKLGTETSTYHYNVRSWLTQIQGSRFNQTLAYHTTVNSVTPSIPRFNGNIGAMKWKAGTETTERGYQLTYDGLSRLTNAAYGEGTSLTANINRYNEAVSNYDKMGNILSLQRQGMHDSGYGMIDNLTYTYSGNQLTKVTDAATAAVTYYGAFQFTDGANVTTEYIYDKNGNLKKDYNKKIVDIQYNSLNLPDGLQFTNGNTVNYVYNAAGQKLSVTHRTAIAGIVIPMTNVMQQLTPANILATTSTDYCGNVIYENGTLGKILTGEGYITLSGATPVYHYFLKDHQGNNRVVINQGGTVEQVNHYYPFGGLFGESTAGGVQPYKYNGKELDRMHGLDLYDYGARHYDAALGRWLTVDLLAEKYYSVSSYVYVGNNPVNAVDLRGDSITIVHNKGFLGLGGKETLIYENGNLFHADGSAYTGKVKGYLKSAVSALGNLNTTTEGASLISELQNSTNMFTIKSGDNSFVPNSSSRAGANLTEVQTVTGNTIGSSGSGGTIYWNANSTSGGLDLTRSTFRPAYIGLGHEMGHASDANQGLLYFSRDYTNTVTGATYFSNYNGLLKSEWRAVYRENLIRGQAGIPLRVYYGIDISTGVPIGVLPRLLTPANLPINYR